MTLTGRLDGLPPAIGRPTDLRASQAQRAGITIVLAAVGGASWLALSDRGMASDAMGLDPAGFFVTWSLMVGGMMLPTILPMVVAFVALTSALPRPARAVRIAAFVAPYLGIWLAAGGAALGLRLASAGQPLVTAALIAGAGLYQLSALKEACLRACRSPFGFFLQYGGELGSLGGAVRLGVRHAALCFGCCAGLMVALTGAAAMELSWMAALGLVMLLEKSHPFGRRLARVSGVMLLGAGPLSLLVPVMGPSAFASGVAMLGVLVVLAISRPRDRSAALAT